MGFLFKPGTPQFVHFRDRVLDHQIGLESLTDDALTFSPGEYAPHLHRKINGDPRNPDFRAFVRSLLQGMRSYTSQRQPWFYERRGENKGPSRELTADVLLLRASEEHNQRYQDAMNERVGLPRGEFERYPADFHWGAVTTGRVEVQTLDTDHLLMCTTHHKELGLAVDDFFRRLEAADDVANWIPEADCGAC
jgi:hypothetical protein